jgi:CheY-like chemotaxis protein
MMAEHAPTGALSEIARPHGARPAPATRSMTDPAPSTDDEQRTVLLVEDDEDSRFMYGTILRHVGYAVREAVDGEAALAIARGTRPSLILMDISVPIVDGLEATRRLKRDPATACIPVIALTAHALPSDRERCIEAGCDGYLAKPCEPKMVVDTVRRFLR